MAHLSHFVSKSLTSIACAAALLLAGLVSAGPTAAQTVAPNSQKGVIVLPVNGDVTTTVESQDAGDHLDYGIDSPRHQEVCNDCQAGASLDLGHFEVGDHLIFYLTDESHQETYLSTDTGHAHIRRVSPLQWTIHWDDGGGDGDYNDLVTSVVLTH